MTEREILTLLRLERIRRGLPTHELATAVGLGRSTVSHHEHGRRRLTLRDLVKYADALGLDVLVVPRIAGDHTDTETTR